MNKIVIKLIGMIMALFLVVLIPLGYVANQIFSNFYYNQAIKEVRELSQKYARTINTLNDEKIISMFLTLADLTNKEILIIDNSGRVVAASGIDIQIPESDLVLLENRNPLETIYTDEESSIDYLGSGYPIVQANTFQGAFFVLTSVSEVEEPIKKIKDLLILSAVGAIFIALGFTFVFSRKMSEPLIEMEKATREIAKGNLEIRVKTRSNDEVGSLAEAINDLAVETNRYRANRREFFANISHELRTPITYLQGYSRVIKNALYQTENEKNQYLDIIEKEADRLTRLIDDLFDLAKMEEGKIDLQFEPVNLTEIVNSALEKAKITVDKTNQVSLRKELIGNNHYLTGDPIRLEQILSNLIGNAIRYTDQGVVAVKLWNTKKHIFVSITDTGIGIPEEDLPFIFERFHRVEKSRSRELGGTGLGLAIVKNLVELHDGNISVNSQIGKGSTFTIKFPKFE